MLTQSVVLSTYFFYDAKMQCYNISLRYPFLACEILCSEIWTITESIYRDESLLDVLFAFLDQPPPLSPLLASYTSRVAQALLSRRTSEVCVFLSLSTHLGPSQHLPHAFRHSHVDHLWGPMWHYDLYARYSFPYYFAPITLSFAFSLLTSHS